MTLATARNRKNYARAYARQNKDCLELRTHGILQALYYRNLYRELCN